MLVEYQGLQFVFNEKSPLLIERTNSTDEEFFVAGYQHNDNNLLVHFDQGVDLVFNHDDDQLNISSTIPAALDNPTSLRIPFMLSTDSQSVSPGDIDSLDITNSSGRYILTLPLRSYINFEENLINIPRDGLDKSIRYTREVAGNELAATLLVEDQLDTLSTEQYVDVIHAYIDNAYLAWKNDRYNSTEGTWSMGAGDAQFSEAILVSFLSEAWSRDEYTRAFFEMRAAADLHPSALTYRSSVFLGDLRNATNDLEVEERRENSRIVQLINQDNAMVFLTPNLFQYAGDRGGSNVLTSLLSFTERIAPGSLTPLEALGISMNYYLGSFPKAEIRQPLRRFENLIEDKILPNIEQTSEGFFFLTETNTVHSYYSIIAGQVLMAAGASRQDEQLINLGHNITLSMLQLSNQMGFLPSQITISGNTILASSGILLPEDIYPLLTDNPYYPQRISLADHFGYGAWGYTSITNYTIFNEPGEFVLSFSNTPDRTHYLFFRGIPNIDALDGMELFGLVWRNAPDFEIYSKGRYYDAESKTLMLKFFDDEVRQDIKLYY